jgi:recombination protein U
MIYSNKGKGLEDLIEFTCSQYDQRGIALIQKVPTPVKVIRQGKEIVRAFFEKKSTVDFIGNFKGVPIAFDAKQTKNKTAFPLSSLEIHQEEFLKRWSKGQGNAFLIIECITIQKVFLLKIEALERFRIENKRKSIPFTWLEHHCKQIKSKNGIALDFLSLIEEEIK